MRRVFKSAVLALVGFASAPSMADVAAAHDTLPLSRVFAGILTEAGVPGGAYAVVRDGRIVDTAVHGVRRLGDDDPVTADTVFRIASLSKTFAAQIGAMLVQEGRLGWDWPVSDFAPAFRLKRAEQTARLQLQHLLGQATGVVPNAYDNLLEADVPLARILPQFASLEPICPTGRCYTYQNILFSLVQPAYEQVTGDTYATLVETRLFRPLGMTGASLGREAYLSASDRAWPHVRKQGIWQTADVSEGYYQVLPAAGINASINDMARWLLAQTGSHPDVISEDHRAALTQPRVATPRELRRHGWKGLLTEAHYGLGWRIYKVGTEELVMHSGWVRGFVADIAYSPTRRTGLVVLINGESRRINDFTTTFWRRTLGLPEAPADAEVPAPSGSPPAGATASRR